MAVSVINDPAAISATGVWGFNILTSVGIIMVNKLVLSEYGFKYPTTLTSLHFIFTALVGTVSSYLTPPENKPNVVPLKDLIIFSIAANGSLVGMNLSLMLNTVGFYQIAKLSVIPTICFFEWAMNGKMLSRDVRIAVGVVMVGVGICTVTSFGVNLPGFLAALTAVICTAVQQIGLILLSCILAVGCNLSQYLCIGKYSAVTFQVLGNMKTVLILVLGAIFFSAPISVKNGAGITVAILGMFMYSWAAERAKTQKDAVSLGVELPTNQKVELESNDREGKGEVNHEGEEKVALLSAVSKDEP